MTYFCEPKQVMFAEPWADEVNWLRGIAYRDEVICACCGGTFDIGEIEESAKGQNLRSGIYPYEEWVDISEEIYGGELPNGLSLYKDEIYEDEKLFSPNFFDEE